MIIAYLFIYQQSIAILSSMRKRSKIIKFYYESSSSSQSNDSNFEIDHGKKSKCFKNPNFEKNYPKNILISIITSLNLTHQRSVYQDQGIYEQQIQSRNSASLLDIFKIIDHPQMKSINKESYQILASNILLQNSKILKKAFHLYAIRDIFSFPNDATFENFKQEMKKKAKKICENDSSNVDIFQFQSSTMYIVNVFNKAIENNLNLIQCMHDNKESTSQEIYFQKSQEQKKKEKNQNIQCLKSIVHTLCHKLNNRKWKKQKMQQVYDSVRNLIVQTQQKMRQKLNLKPDVPYLRLFCPQVMTKCFDQIKRKQKINSSSLQKWIKNFEKQTLTYIVQKIFIWNQPIEEIQNCSEIKQQDQKAQKWGEIYKEFSPIILTAPK